MPESTSSTPIPVPKPTSIPVKKLEYRLNAGIDALIYQTSSAVGPFEKEQLSNVHNLRVQILDLLDAIPDGEIRDQEQLADLCKKTSRLMISFKLKSGNSKTAEGVDQLYREACQFVTDSFELPEKVPTAEGSKTPTATDRLSQEELDRRKQLAVGLAQKQPEYVISLFQLCENLRGEIDYFFNYDKGATPEELNKYEKRLIAFKELAESLSGEFFKGGGIADCPQDIIDTSNSLIRLGSDLNGMNAEIQESYQALIQKYLSYISVFKQFFQLANRAKSLNRQFGQWHKKLYREGRCLVERMRGIFGGSRRDEQAEANRILILGEKYKVLHDMVKKFDWKICEMDIGYRNDFYDAQNWMAHFLKSPKNREACRVLLEVYKIFPSSEIRFSSQELEILKKLFVARARFDERTAMTFFSNHVPGVEESSYTISASAKGPKESTAKKKKTTTTRKKRSKKKTAKRKQIKN